MSYFSVLVVTKTDSETALEKAMQPFHEFECDGNDDKYVQDIDKTEELRQEFKSHARTFYRDPEGNRHDAWEDRFYRDPTEEEKKTIGPMMGSGAGHGISWASKDWGDGKGYRSKVHFLPEGWEEIEVPRCEFQSLAEFAEDWFGHQTVLEGQKPDLKDKHKYGYCVVNAKGDVVKCIDRTNPNKKWDGWSIGGRCAGKFWLKGRYGATDSGRKSELDMERMKSNAVSQRRELVQECCGKADMTQAQFGEALQQKFASEPLWQALEEPRPRGNDYYSWLADNGFGLLAKASRANPFDMPEIEQGQTLQEWIEDAPAITAFALLDADGNWHERGRMGWWASVHDEKENWSEIFKELFAKIPDNYHITNVSCHI